MSSQKKLEQVKFCDVFKRDLIILGIIKKHLMSKKNQGNNHYKILETFNDKNQTNACKLMCCNTYFLLQHYMQQFLRS